MRDVAGHARDLAKLFRAHFKKKLVCDFETEAHLLCKLDNGKGAGKIENFQGKIFNNSRAHIHSCEGLGPLRRACE
jgi:hypothetical protein